MSPFMRRLGISLAVASVSVACGTENPLAPGTLPAWLMTVIAELESQPVANPPASITRYEYHGTGVYYLSPRCCDIPSVLYNADGAVLCRPDGGFDGRGDGRCPDFLSARKNGVLVWRDPRGGG